ncbi:MAG: phage minor capsid protein [Lachnospiraceae bacterium]
MLLPKELDKLPDRVVELYAELENDIIRDMARRIVKTDFATDTAQWQLIQLHRMSVTHDEVFDRLSKATGKSKKELVELFNDAANTAFAREDKAYRKAGYKTVPLAENVQLQKIINAGLRKTEYLFENLTSTTANTATRQFENALDRAYMQITPGAFDYSTAIRTCIRDLAQKGIAYITYPSGHTDYLDVAVRRAALTGVGQTCGEMQLELAAEMDCDLVEVTAHNGARPEHAVWQGKVFSLSGKHPKYPDFKKSTGYGTGAGLKGWNCRHDFFPFFEDSKPAYTQAELAEFENRQVTYNGEKMTEYDATQKQRAMERRIRATKRELAGYDAGIAAAADENLKAELQTAFDRKSVLLKRQEAALRDFTKQTGLARDRAREQVSAHFDVGQGKTVAFNKSVSQKAVNKAEAHYQQWIREIGATDSAPKSLAQYYKNKYNDTWEHQLLTGYNKAVQKGDVSPLVGFGHYVETAKQANAALIGLKTQNGYTVEAYTTHFIDRVIGQVAEPHSGKRLGVPIEDVVNCLLKPVGISDVYTHTIQRNGKSFVDERIRFFSDKCDITFSITEAKIVQTNPRKKK